MGLVQLVVAEPADEEMAVVHERVGDAGRREVGGELRLPDALGEPQSGRIRAEALLQVVAHPADLLQAIFSWQRCQNRLVESGEQQLEFAVCRQSADHVEPGGVVPLQPFEQRP